MLFKSTLANEEGVPQQHILSLPKLGIYIRYTFTYQSPAVSRDAMLVLVE